MKKLLFLLPMVLMALGCTTKPGETTSTDANAATATAAESQKPAALPEVKLTCREIRGVDDEIPMAEIVLQVGDQQIPVDSCNVCEELTTEMWELYEIPKSAQQAVGGWWAGAGDYFYLTVEGEDAVVRYGWAAEEAEEKDMYQYEEIKRVKLR